MTTFRENQQRLRELRRERSNAIMRSRVQSDANIRIVRPRYNANGTITRSGGTPERPRGNLSNSGQRAGTRVSTANGQVVGQSRAGGQQTENEIKVLQDRLAKLSATIPTRLITGDPNAQTPDLLPNYLDDLVYDTDTGTLYRWNIDASPAAEWQPLQQLYQGFTGVPAADVRIDGAAAINDTGVVYTGTISGGWVETAGIEDLHGYIEATESKTYPLITSASYAVTVVSLSTGGASTATAVTSPTVGSTVAAGDTLGLVVSSGDGDDLSFTIKLARA